MIYALKVKFEKLIILKHFPLLNNFSKIFISYTNI